MNVTKGDLLNELISKHLEIKFLNNELYELYKRKDRLEQSESNSVLEERYKVESKVLGEKIKEVEEQVIGLDSMLKPLADAITSTDETDKRIQELRQNLTTFDLIQEGHFTKINKKLNNLENKF